jgi:hypothetical protein
MGRDRQERSATERRWKSDAAGGAKTGRLNGDRPRKSPAEHEILFQNYFKSIGPRTYAAQVKRASNGNHYLVLTEGKRDDESAAPRLTRLFVFSEDFPEFFKLLQATAQFIKATPVPPEVARKRQAHWSKRRAAPAAASPPLASRQGR